MPSTRSLLSTHGLALAAIARRPDSRIRDIAEELDITERTAQRIVGDLVEEGFAQRIRAGRRNRYVVKGERGLRGGEASARILGELLPEVGLPDLDVAECEAVVLACSDHRLQPRLQAFLADLGLTGRAELVLWPGGGPALAGARRTEILRALSDVVERRQPNRLLLVSHAGCEVPAVPTVAAATPPATYRAVRRWGRRVAPHCVGRPSIAPPLWVLGGAKASMVADGRRAGAGQRGSARRLQHARAEGI